MGLAEDDELMEAPQVSGGARQAAPAGASGDQRFRYRAYAFVEGRWMRSYLTGAGQFNGPYLEADATVDYKASEQWKLFIDGMAYYSRYTSSGTGVINQIGVRFHPHEDWVLAVGRERNRRSPGMFVSPADFLHTNPALAGPREIRTGEWIARASHQTANQSTDFIYVPFRTLTLEGLPGESVRAEGLVRHFHKLGPIDLDLSAGYLDGKAKAGASVLGFVWSVWKLYAELGYHSSPLWSGLGGVAYEGSDDFSIRAEIFYSSQATLTPVALPGGWSGIVSVVFPEVWDRFNFYLTGMAGLSSNVAVGLVRAEWLVNSRNTMGSSFLSAPTGDLQWTLDWRFSF